jgi:hypothetical protein
MAAKSDNKVVITCAITGSIHTPTMSDALPITPDQIAQQAIAAAEARLAEASPEERARLEEEIRGYREALSESSGGLVPLRSPRA